MNPCAKTRPVDNPYEVYKDDSAGWEWRVLKKYQAPENEAQNPYARWFCAVKSPFTYDSWEYGDVYIHDIPTYVRKSATHAEMQDVRPQTNT